MNKGLGVIGLVVGVLLIVWGYHLSQSVSGQFARSFTGSPGDQSMWLYVGGSALVAFGAYQILTGRR